jgi:hypothetical protein
MDNPNLNVNLANEVRSTIAIIKSLEEPPAKGTVWEALSSKSPDYADLGRKLCEVVYARS